MLSIGRVVPTAWRQRGMLDGSWTLVETFHASMILPHCTAT